MSRTHVDIRDVVDGLHALKARASDLRPVMREVLGLMGADITDHFEKQSGPDGRWPARAPSTLERARQRRGFVRKRGARRGQLTRRGERWAARMLGRFRGLGGYKAYVGPQDATVKARGVWAPVHQFGGVAGRGSRIPARPFLWASDDLVEKFGAVLRKHLREAW